MGSGKGSLDHYVSVIKKGTVLFEMDGVDEATAKEAMRLAGQKLPVKVKYINSNAI
jgi:large subunit ribosomal protein L16